jgi:hypothetical protein
MRVFAIYKKSKRAKDLHLVAWPINAANEADALTEYLEQQRAAGRPVKERRWRERLRVVPFEPDTRSGMAGPPQIVSHVARGKDTRRKFRSL